MILDIPPVEIFRTLSYSRSNKTISRTFGISYSQLTSWLSSVEKNESGSAPEYVIYILLEYFKRYNPEEEERVMQKYKLSPDVTDNFLESYLFSVETLGTYVASSVIWKSDLIDSFHHKNSLLFREQLFYLDNLARCTYPHMPKITAGDDKDMVENLIDAAPDYI